jgi:Core-2/I-Branching enzyme.
MRFAYAIICHKNPEQINFLIDSLSNNNDDIYILCDKKNSIKKDLLSGSNIYIVDSQINIKWATHHQIDATLEILKAVTDSKKQYDFIWLISGQDYPIKPRDKIVSYLENNPYDGFFELDKKGAFPYLNRIRFRYPSLYFGNSFKNKLYRKAFKVLKIFLQRNISGRIYYKGSNWFTLTPLLLEYIINYINENPWYLKLFRNSYCGDELFFHTIVFNSPFAKNIKSDYLREINWNDPVSNPHVYTINDLQLLKESNSFFARKFDMNIDSQILYELKKII